jgi:hypothetical protein
LLGLQSTVSCARLSISIYVPAGSHEQTTAMALAIFEDTIQNNRDGVPTGLEKELSKQPRVQQQPSNNQAKHYRVPAWLIDYSSLQSYLPTMLSCCPCHLNTATKSKALGIPFAAVALFCHHSPLTTHQSRRTFCPYTEKKSTEPIDQPLLSQFNRWPSGLSPCLASRTTNHRLICNGHLFDRPGGKRKKTKNTSSKKKTRRKH